jgi:hypothetical protein
MEAWRQEGRCEMSSISHPPTAVVPERRRRSGQLLIAEMWASLAITAMWIAVAVTSVWGTDFVSNSGPGGSSTTIPAGIVVALFACIGSSAVAKRGFARRNNGNDQGGRV